MEPTQMQDPDLTAAQVPDGFEDVPPAQVPEGFEEVLGQQVPTTEAVQKELLTGMLSELRQQYEMAKLQWHLRVADHPKLTAAGNEFHPEKIKGHIGALARCLAVVEGFIAQEVIPLPTKLEVRKVTAAPKDPGGPPAA